MPIISTIQSIFTIVLRYIPHKPLDWYKYINLAHKYCRWDQHIVEITRTLSAPKALNITRF